MFRRGSTWFFLRHLWQVARGRHLNLPEVQMLQRQSFRVEAAGNVAVAVQVDGDQAGRLPIEVEIIPGGLKLLVSARAVGRLGVTLPLFPARRPDPQERTDQQSPTAAGRDHTDRNLY